LQSSRSKKWLAEDLLKRGEHLAHRGSISKRHISVLASGGGK
jgi:hypothetical protein